MRTSSTILVFVLAAVASTPAFGAPLKTDSCDRFPSACTRVARGTQDYSGALSLKPTLTTSKDILKAIGKVIKASAPKRSDFIDVEARNHDDSGALNIGPQSHVIATLPLTYLDPDGVWDKFGTDEPTTPPQIQQRDINELLARDDESDALSISSIFDIGKGIFDVGKTLFGGDDNQQQRREFVELLTRAAADGNPESDALSITSIFDIGKGIFDFGKTLFGGDNNQQQRREFIELLTRAAADGSPESDALSITSIFDIGKGIFDFGKTLFGGDNNQQQRREFIELLTRAAADGNPESDALSITSIFDIGKGIFDFGKTLFGGDNNQQQQREFVELLTRAAADGNPESDALSISSIFDIGKGIFDFGKTLFGGNDNQQQRREFIEFLSRRREPIAIAPFYEQNFTLWNELLGRQISDLD